jgi:hypothetical protein
MAAGNPHALLAALIPPKECLGDVRLHEIYHTTLLLLVRGLLVEGEANDLSLNPLLTHHSENIVQNGQRTTAIVATNTLHVLTCSFFISFSISLGTHLTDFWESFRAL